MIETLKIGARRCPRNDDRKRVRWVGRAVLVGKRYPPLDISTASVVFGGYLGINRMARGYCIRGGVLFMDAPAEFMVVQDKNGQTYLATANDPPFRVIFVSAVGAVAVPCSLIPH